MREARTVRKRESRLVIIYGPTATGKTDLAINLAKKYSGEIISADSRQVYRGLDIGTGKVSFDSKVKKQEGYWIVDDVRINGFDLVTPGQQFTAADFLKFANTSMARITKAGKLPIVVGGTGFYVKALLEGINSLGIPANQRLRRKLEKRTTDELARELEKVSPQRAHFMNESDRKNPRRLIRAIEIALSSKKKLLPTTNYQPLATNYLLIGLTAANEYLYRRVDNWLKTRLEKGMIDEVGNLIKNGTDPHWLENLGLEYRWATRIVLGKIPKDQAIERLRGDIHNFIRRQKTWFKKLKGIKLYNISTKNWQQELEKIVKDWYNQGND